MRKHRYSMQRTSKIEANQGTKTSQSEGREEGHGRLEHTTVGRAICVGENPSLEDLWRAYIQYEHIEDNANAVKMLSRKTEAAKVYLLELPGSY
ncbi:hypothetical protein FOCG_17367 [Fusarium oxysporum f. sp. radicis-lycopersici 26381]|nr:hypothetical protein FOCG_17367 [Fusarium oxysporum f. sp. radicis-lycopersici 26381]